MSTEYILRLYCGVTDTLWLYTHRHATVTSLRSESRSAQHSHSRQLIDSHYTPLQTCPIFFPLSALSLFIYLCFHTFYIFLAIYFLNKCFLVLLKNGNKGLWLISCGSGCFLKALFYCQINILFIVYTTIHKFGVVQFFMFFLLLLCFLSHQQCSFYCKILLQLKMNGFIFIHILKCNFVLNFKHHDSSLQCQCPSEIILICWFGT